MHVPNYRCTRINMFSRKTKIKTQAHTGPLLPLAKKKRRKKVMIKQAHTRESGCGVGRRGNIHSSKHMVCRRPPADHQMWEDYVTVVRLAAKHTNQPSRLQKTIKSLALIKPHYSFSFLCFFPFLNYHYDYFTLDRVGIGNLCGRNRQ